MAIEQSIIQTTDTTLLTVPAGKRYAITTILVCNTYNPAAVDAASNDTEFDLHLVKNGQARSNTNMIVRSLNLPAGETFTFDSEKIVLEAGDRVIFLGQAPTNLSATVSWLEV
jgi:hypothetical protein